MVKINYLQVISWKAFIIALLLFVLPNFLLMKIELVGSVTPEMALGTVLDLAIILPLVCYFFVLRRKPTLLVLIPLSFAGLFLANWFVPDYADQYLNMINKSVIVLEAGLILLEIILLIVIFKRLPMLKKLTKKMRNDYHHFLRSFIEAGQVAFSFRFKKLNQYQNLIRFLSTDLAVLYYAFFSWRKKNKFQHQNLAFTYHRNGEYQGVFVMLVHALAIEIIAVHLIVMQFNHVLAWVVTGLDLYALLFVIADYQAIRLSPVILDNKAIHIQKGLRFHIVIPFEKIMGMERNEDADKTIKKDKNAFDLTLSGLESQKPQFKILCKEPIQGYSIFGFRKIVDKIYVTVDEAKMFQEKLNALISKTRE